MRPILELNQRIAALERRFAGLMRHGTVAEVDTAAGWVRLDLGPGAGGPLLSPKIPYAQMAGALKVHTPPSEGQQMTIVAPGGDMRQAIALPMTWSNENASPGDTGDPVITYGDVRVAIEPDAVNVRTSAVEISISGGEVTITASGSVTVNSPSVNLGGEGGQPVARIGDMVAVGSGSSAGTWPIVSGSDVVKAT